MSTKSKAIVNLKSSEKVANFLESNHLHKKDFAEMIGVTLSYAVSYTHLLIDICGVCWLCL